MNYDKVNLIGKEIGINNSNMVKSGGVYVILILSSLLDAMGLLGGADGRSARDAHPRAARDRHPRAPHAARRQHGPLPAAAAAPAPAPASGRRGNICF